MTNYNNLGDAYEARLFANQPIGTDCASIEAMTYAKQLRAEITVRLKFDLNDTLSRDLSALLRRVESIYYHSNNLSRFVASMMGLPKRDINGEYTQGEPPLQVYRDHLHLSIEAESLILHAVAALDSLSTLSSKYLKKFKIAGPGRPKAQFSNLHLGLKESAPHDARSLELQRIYAECSPYFAGVIHNPGGKPVRNIIAHHMDLAEISKGRFTFYWLENGKVLRFDQQMHGLPLVKTLRSLIQGTSYLVTKACAIYLAFDEGGTVKGPFLPYWNAPRDWFEPTWQNPLLSIGDFVSDSEMDDIFTFATADEVNIYLNDVRLKSEVFQLAVDLPLLAHSDR